MIYYWYGKFKGLTATQALFNFNTAKNYQYQRNCKKKEKKFLSQNLKYALYENTEGSFCARWNPVNFCHTGLRAPKAPTHHASSTLSCWLRAIGSIALQSNYEGDLKGKFHIKHTTCTKLASSFQYWIGAQKSISGWKSGANYGHLKIMTMWNQSSKRKALLTVQRCKKR